MGCGVGSQAYVHVPDVKRSKKDARATKLVFVRYSLAHKDYRFLDPEMDLITISRDAKFLELGSGTSTVEIPFFVPSSATSAG